MPCKPQQAWEQGWVRWGLLCKHHILRKLHLRNCLQNSRASTNHSSILQVHKLSRGHNLHSSLQTGCNLLEARTRTQTQTRTQTRIRTRTRTRSWTRTRILKALGEMPQNQMELGLKAGAHWPPSHPHPYRSPVRESAEATHHHRSA